jgi:uncharacterized protein YdaU (DUF1376 family)
MSVPYIPLYIDDFDAATAHLSVAEEGCYMRLIKLAWRSATCSIVDDIDWIARKTRAPKAMIKAILAEFFTLKNGVWTQKRLKREFDDVRKKISARKKAGKLGGLAKQQKSNEKTSSNASLLLKHPEPEPEPEPELESSSSFDVDSGAGKVVPIRPNISKPKLPDDFPGARAHVVLIETINSPWLDMSKSGGLQSPAEIARWVTQGCDWSLDVVPTIQAIMAKRKSAVGGWGYFTNAVFEARDTRLREGPPAPVAAKPRRSPEDQALWQIWDDFGYWAKKDNPWPMGKEFPGFERIRTALERFGKPEDIEVLEDSIQFCSDRKAQ